MPANNYYLTSLLSLFSTFLENSGFNGVIAQKTRKIFALYIQKKNPQTWKLEEISKFVDSHTQLGIKEKKQVKHILNQFVLTHTPHQTNVFLHQFLLALKKDGCSKSTVKNYRSDISQFLSFTNKLTVAEAITKPKIASFVGYQQQKGLKNSSIQRKLKSINQFGGWLKRQNILDTNPVPNTDPDFYQHLANKVETTDKVLDNSAPIGPAYKTPAIYYSPQDSRLADAQKRQERRAQAKERLTRLSQKVKVQTKQLALTYLNFLLILLFFLGLGVFGYQQFFKNAEQKLAYPTSLTAASRVLSFQGRLTDTAENPITTSTNFVFQLYDSGPSTSGGNELWNSGTCGITPDQDGIFSTGLGSDCGSEITDDVFTENANVWLQVTVASETLSPRQPIRTVAYAINAETLQGYPASASAVENTVLVMDNSGQVVLGNTSPVIKSTGDSLTIEAQTITVQTSSGSDGDILLSPDGLGEIIAESYVYAPGATLSATYAEGVPLSVLGGPSGTGNITEWQNSSGTALSVIDSDGYLGIGTSAPTTLLQLGTSGTTAGTLSLAGSTSGLVTIDTAAAAGTWSFTLPSDDGTNGYVLQTDGSGNTSWTAQTGGSTYWDLTSEQIHPKNALWYDLLIGNTATSSATFYAQANTGNTYVGGTLQINSLGSGSTDYVLVDEGSGLLARRQIDSKAWGGSLTDGSGTQHYVARWTDSDSLGTGLLYDDTTKVGIGTSSPSQLFHVYDTSLAPQILVTGAENSDSIYSSLGLYEAGGTAYGFEFKYLGASDRLAITNQLDTEWVTILRDSGYVGIDSTSPQAELDIDGDFIVSGTTQLNSQTYTWPSSQTLNYVLATNGSGTLTWSDPVALSGGTNYWTMTSEQIHPKNAEWHDLLIGGTSTSSAQFVAQANNGNVTVRGALSSDTIKALTTSGLTLADMNSNLGIFIENSTGYVGIASTNPGEALDITGNLKLSGTTEFNSIAYTWPGSITNSYILQTDGSGNLSWQDPNVLTASTTYWDQTNEQVYPKNTLWHDLMIGGTATSSAKFYVQANTGEVYVDQNLGVGTTVPASALDVGSTTGGVLTISRDDSAVVANDSIGELQFYSNDSDLTDSNIVSYIRSTAQTDFTSTGAYGRLEFGTADSAGTPATRVVIDQSGYVGINTTAPTAKLDIRGLGSADFLNLYDTSTEVVTIEGSGYVGLGTTNPTRKLEVYGTDNYLRINQDNSDYVDIYVGDSATVFDANSGYFDFRTNGSYGMLIRQNGDTSDWGSILASDDYFSFGKNTTNQLVIEDGGDVGIGTTNPGTLLQLGTSGTTAGTLSLAGGTSGLVTIDTAAAAGTWSFTLPTSAGSNNYVLTTDGSGNSTWSDPSSITAGSNYWLQTSEQIYPKNALWHDLLVGGTATSSATFVAQAATGDITSQGQLNIENIYALDSDGLSLTDDGGNLGIFIEDGGLVGIGTTNPSQELDVTGDIRLTGSLLLVGATSGVVTIDTAAVAGTWSFTLPTSAGSNNYVLTTDGSGNSTWSDPSSITAGSNYWLQTSEQVYPKNALWHDLMIGGTATSSATFFAQANTGNTYVGGSLGIGTTDPVTELEIVGSIKVPSADVLMYNDTNQTGDPGSDGFRMAYETDLFDTDEDGLVFEKTDYNQSDPDGGIVFATRGSGNYRTISMAIRGNDYIGMGTTNPTRKLDIEFAKTAAGELNSQMAITDTSAYNSSPIAGIGFYGPYNSSGDHTSFGGIAAGKENTTDGNYASYLGLYTRANGSSITEAMRINSSGYVGINTTNPTEELDITGDFQLTGTTGLNGITYTWPATQTNNYILQTNGSGSLSWADPATVTAGTNYWQATNEQIYPKNTLWHDLLIGGSATSSAKFYAQANTGDGYFAGSLGIGTTSPGTLLQLGDPGNTAGTLSLAGGTSGLVTIDTAAAAGTWSFTLPTSGGTNGYVMQTDGSGNTSWVSPSSLTNVGYWDLTSEQLHPRNALWHDLTIGGTSTSSATFHVAANTGALTLRDSDSNEIFTVDETQLTSYVPASFLSSGDVSMAYDLLLTNQTSTTIQSNAPLYITTGESFESNDLTLTTYNSGDLVFNIPGGFTSSQTQTWDLASGTSALNIESGLLNLDTTNSRIGINSTTPAEALDVVGNIDVSGTTEFNNIAYTWPSSQTATYLLQTNGSGTLSWVDPLGLSTASYWALTSEQIHPKNALWHDLLIGGTASSSATFYAQANTGDASMSGTLTIGQGEQLRSQYGSLNLAYKSGADAWTTGMVLNESGYVGIGTTTPTYNLDVAGNIGLDQYLYHNDDADTFFNFTADAFNTTVGNESMITITEDDSQDIIELGDDGDIDIKLSAGADGALFVQGSDGYVGIGTTGPTTLLQLGTSGSTAGTLSLAGGTSGLVTIDTAAAAGTWSFTLPTSGGTNNYILQTDGSGNTSWANPLSLAGGYWDLTSEQLHPKNALWHDLLIGGTATSSATFYAQANTGDASMSGTLTIGQGEQIRSQYGPLNLAYKSGADAWTTGLTLDNDSGYVGIGTTTPTYNLDVAGNIGLDQYLYHNDDTDSFFNFTDDAFNATFGNESMITITEDGSQDIIELGDDGDIDIKLSAGADGALFVQGSDGYVGIGTTTPTYNLDVAGNIGLDQYLYHNDDADTFFNFTADAFNTTVGNESMITITEDDSQDIIELGDDGDIDIKLSAGADGALFVQGSDGYVGIGTTAPTTLLQLGTSGSTAGTLSLAGGTSGLVTIDTAAAAGTWSFTLPSDDGTNGYVLQTDGSGNTSWTAQTGGTSYWDLTSEQIHPKNALWHDLLVGGTATSSATFYAQANTGDASMSGTLTIGQGEQIRSQYGPLNLAYKSGADAWTTGLTLDNNSGYVGIGTTAPSTLLQLGTSGTTAGTLSLAGSTSGLVTIDTVAAAGTWTFTLPTSAGTNGYVLQTDGSGNTSWVEQSGGTSYWDLTNEQLHPKNALWHDLTIGGTSTSSATFHVAANTGALTLRDSGSNDIFTVTESQMTSNVPTNFTSAGDVGIAYDLNFTNQTTSYIKSNAPLYIEAGESFESNPLTLKTYNSGQLSLDLGGGIASSQTQAWDLADGTSALNFESGLLNLDTTNTRVGIGTTAPTTLLQLGTSGTTAGTLSLAGGTSGLVTIDTAAAAGTWSFTLPSDDGTNGYVLQTDGSGNTSWTAQTGGTTYWDLTSEQIHPKNALWHDLLVGGTATSSATFYAKANTGDGYFGGSLGIGTTSPDRPLHVASTNGARFGTSSKYVEIFTSGSGNDINSTNTLHLNYSSNQDVSIGEGGTSDLFVSGQVGIGTTSAVSQFDLIGAVTGKALAIFNETGDQDIFTASASGTTRFRIDTNGYAYAERFSDISDTSYYIDPAAGSTSINVAGDIQLDGGGTIQSTSNNDIDIDAGSGTVLIGNGSGKFDAGTIDPPYWVDGKGYATYVSSMIGVKEEITQTAQLQAGETAGLYKYVVDFDNLPEGSGMWLFSRIIDLDAEMKNLVVLLSGHDDAIVSYKKDLNKRQLILYGNKPVEVSFRLTAPRYDHQQWKTLRDNQDGRGLQPEDYLYGNNVESTTSVTDAELLANLQQTQDLSLDELGNIAITQFNTDQAQLVSQDGTLIEKIEAFSSAVIANLRAGIINTQKLVAQIKISSPQTETDLITPFESNNVTVKLGEDNSQPAQLAIKNNDDQTVATINSAGDASFSGGVTAETIDAKSARLDVLESRMAELENIKAQTAELVTATVSGTLYADDIANFQDKISNALQEPTLLESLIGEQQATTESASVAAIFDVVDQAGYIASGSGSLNKSLEELNLNTEDVSLGASAIFINKYFEVNGIGYISDSLGVGNQVLIGEKTRIADGIIEYNATTTNDTLFIQPSGKGTLSLMKDLVVLDETGLATFNGDVLVNGDLQVQDTLLTDLLKPTDFGNPFQVQVAGAATESAEVQESRFEIINELGTPVATISAQGRADFAGGLGIGAEDLTNQTATESAVTSEKTSGKAIIPTGQSQVVISSNKITNNSLIYVTPIGSTGNQVLYVKQQQVDDPETSENEAQFTVGFDYITTKDVQFNWWIVN